MSVRLTARVTIAAPPAAVWAVLVDWAGQRRWIPFTDVRVAGRATGIGVRAEALSGFRLGGWPFGLLDCFVVTGWTPPLGSDSADTASAAELEVLHLGPQFRGEGVFRVAPVELGSGPPVGARTDDTGTEVTCTEVFSLPLGRLTEPVARLALPILRQGLLLSLRRLRTLCESGPAAGDA